MATFTSQRTQTIAARIKRCTKQFEILNCRWGIAHKRGNCSFIAQSCACIKCVSHVFTKCVGRVEHGGQATLCPCGAARIQGVFGDDQYVAHWSRGERWQAECGQPRLAASHHPSCGEHCDDGTRGRLAAPWQPGSGQRPAVPMTAPAAGLLKALAAIVVKDGVGHPGAIDTLPQRAFGESVRELVLDASG